MVYPTAAIATVRWLLILFDSAPSLETTTFHMEMIAVVAGSSKNSTHIECVCVRVGKYLLLAGIFYSNNDEILNCKQKD